MLDEILKLIIPSVGLSVLIASGLIYIFKKFFEKKIETHFNKELETIKSNLTKQNMLLQEISKKQLEVFPPITEAVSRSRSIARDILNDLPIYQSDYRSKLGDLCIQIVEFLLRTRIYLPLALFEILHTYKENLQNFIFKYDLITNPENDEVNEGLLDNLKQIYNEIDMLYKKIVTQSQEILSIA